MSCICYSIQSIFTALNILFSLPIHPFSPQSLAVTDLFTVSIVLPFPERHTVEIIQYIAFSDCFLSLSSMQLRFLHALCGLTAYFFYF